MPSALEMIMKSYKSSYKAKAYKKIDLIMRQDSLFDTMDFNFMDVLSHAIENNSRLAVEYIFGYLDGQAFCEANYKLIIKNMEDLLDKN
jgi:hypothetical protein